MEGKIQESVFICNDCGNLDFAPKGICKKCGGTNLAIASQDIKFDNTSHNHLMKVIYAQHEQAFFNSKE